MNEDTKINILLKEIKTLKAKVEKLEKFKEKSKETTEVISKNFLLMSKTMREKSLIQQQIAEQLVSLTESLDAIENAINPSKKIGYDITKEPYN